ncbi:MAG: TolB family protein [Candidatus Krumholzibacteriia bacterium]
MRITGSSTFWGRLAGGVLVLTALFSGCGDSGPGDGVVTPESTAIKVDGIIFNPKSPTPGDTMMATAVVTSGSLNPGDFVGYQWSVDGGTLLDTGKTSVRWVAPDTTSGTLFTVTVRATNAVSTSTGSGKVLVNRITTLVGSRAGEVHPTSTGDSIYYLSSNLRPTQFFFNGFEIMLRDGSGTTTTVNPNRFGTEYKFNRTLTQAVHVETEFISGSDKLKQIYHDDLLAGVSIPLPIMPLQPLQRKPQFTEPDFSPDDRLIVYQAFLPDAQKPPAQGGVDTFEVFVYDIGTQQVSRVTHGLASFHPSFSSDGAFMVFMSDTTASQNGAWELYALPVTGGVVSPDTIGPLTELTTSGGIVGSGSPPSVGARAWNGNAADPVLAIVDANDKLNLVRTDGSGALVVNVADKVKDFAWAPGGSQLAMTAGNSIYVVSSNASAQSVNDILVGDRVSRLSWSGNEDYLIYNVVRSTDSWYELIDITGATGLLKPVRISGAVSNGNAADYSSLLVTRPAWAPNATTAYLMFFFNPTPRLSTLSLSGLTP